MVAFQENQTVSKAEIQLDRSTHIVKKKAGIFIKENMLKTLFISTLALVMLVKRVLTQTNTQAPNVNVHGPTRHVVPRTYNPGWYPMWDAHYTDNFYVASGKDDISWGRERHTDNEDPDRSERRVWIEAIQDHEGFAQDPGRDEVITCGIGGCEWYTLDVNGGPTTAHPSGNERDGAAQNKTVFRHQHYWDWLGRTVTNPGLGGAAIAFGGANTFRSDHVSTVAIIQYTSHFLAGGTVDRGVTRYNYRAGNNTYWLHNLEAANLAAAALAPLQNNQRNVSTDVTDLFVVRPTNWFVICRTRMRYEIADYTNMGNVGYFVRDGTGTPIEELHTGGFGDYIDYRRLRTRVCISHDYTDMITCWDLTPAGAATPAPAVHRKFRTGWPIRSLKGYYESPHFAVCGRKWIKVYNTWDVSAAVAAPGYNVDHVALFEEGVGTEGSVIGNDFNRQIWDIVYINTRGYPTTDTANFLGGGAGATTLAAATALVRARNSNGTGADTNAWDLGWLTWAYGNRRHNRWFGPSRGQDRLGSSKGEINNIGRFWIGDIAPPDIWTGINWGIQDPQERLFYVTHDRGKIVWWSVDGALEGGNQNVCHPFCQDSCYFPFNHRYCAGATCRTPVNGDAITPPPGAITGGLASQTDHAIPPQCTPDNYNGGQWGTVIAKTYDTNFNDGWFTNANQQTVNNPFTATPLTKRPPVMEQILNAVIPGTAPPPFVPVPHSEQVVNNTQAANPVRTESSEWWKWWLLFLALLLLLLVLLLALCCGPKQRVRQPIKKVEEEVPIVVEEKVEVKAPKEVVVEEKVYKPTKKQVVIEKKPVKRVEEKVVVKEKVGFNPYKQKSVDFRL